jgi:hypothetical protein
MTLDHNQSRELTVEISDAIGALFSATNGVVNEGVNFQIKAASENYDLPGQATRVVKMIERLKEVAERTTARINERIDAVCKATDEAQARALDEVKAKIRPEWLWPRVLRARKAIAEYDALDKSAADEFRSESRYFYNQAREELDARVADPDRFQSCLNLTLDQAEANLKQIRDGFYDYDRTGLSRKLGQLQAQTEIFESQLLTLVKAAA